MNAFLAHGFGALTTLAEHPWTVLGVYLLGAVAAPAAVVSRGPAPNRVVGV
ncbi:hypothetical protein [Streptomyces sp. NPDC093225]|uniref:hypothetical protein n=1 Tax=Streptomyces sp. NPDC093225 TaxID=3366034 RepID=UPI0037F53A10